MNLNKTHASRHDSDLIKLEQEQRPAHSNGAAAASHSAAGRGGLVSRSEERMRRLMRRSVVRGLSLVGLGFWVSPHTWREWDRAAFRVTHRLLLGEEGRLRSARFTPALVDLLSWWMSWPVLIRRTGELPSSATVPVASPTAPPPPPPSPLLGGQSASSPGRATW
jgi:hypothetical protein